MRPSLDQPGSEVGRYEGPLDYVELVEALPRRRAAVVSNCITTRMIQVEHRHVAIINLETEAVEQWLKCNYDFYLVSSDNSYRYEKVKIYNRDRNEIAEMDIKILDTYYGPHSTGITKLLPLSGNKLACSYRLLTCIWDLEIGKELLRLEGTDPMVELQGYKLASASVHRDKICIWDTHTGVLMDDYAVREGKVTSLAVRQDEMLVYGTSNGKIGIWGALNVDYISDPNEFEIGSTAIHALQVLHNDEIACLSGEQTIILVDPTMGSRSILKGHGIGSSGSSHFPMDAWRHGQTMERLFSGMLSEDKK